MTSIATKLAELRTVLPHNVGILTDQSDALFKDLMRRWSDIDLKIPSAIVLPTSEEEIQKTVCELVNTRQG